MENSSHAAKAPGKSRKRIIGVAIAGAVLAVGITVPVAANATQQNAAAASVAAEQAKTAEASVVAADLKSVKITAEVEKITDAKAKADAAAVAAKKKADEAAAAAKKAAQAKAAAEKKATEDAAVASKQAKEAAANLKESSLASNSWTVQPVDTLSSLANYFGLDVEAFSAANGIFPNSEIYIGTSLKLKGPNVRPAPVEAPAKQAPAPQPAAPQAPAAQPQVQAAAQPAPAPPAPVNNGVDLFVPVVAAGGQGAIDQCAGPVHFTPLTQFVSIAEHDYCGGWARFNWLQVGHKVTVQGFGTYTVVGRQVVNQGGNTGDINFAGGFPPVILQTCIPGTTTMLLIGLR